MTLLAAALALALAPPLLSWAAVLSVHRARPGDGARGPGAAGAVRLAGYAASLPLAVWTLSAAGRPAGGLLAGFAPPELGETLAVGLGLAAVLGFLSLAVRHGGTLVLRWAYRASGRSPHPELSSATAAASAWRFPAASALLIAVAAAVYEELVWRGLLQAGLSGRLGVPAAVAVASLAFAALHARQGPVAVVFSGAAAALLGAAFAWRADLAAVVLAHAAYNASAVAVDRWDLLAARQAGCTAGAGLSVSIPR